MFDRWSQGCLTISLAFRMHMHSQIFNCSLVTNFNSDTARTSYIVLHLIPDLTSSQVTRDASIGKRLFGKVSQQPQSRSSRIGNTNEE